ncbi:hypothetical protein NYP18_09250 [Corynebacterium sp. YIM 101645]|uniref:Uncharacterized protein n=1 Tax=Corynebacterium lemuris TaxID=1859292 RepID=A0ABT2FX79_9CORY|nr:hypothetical protein [Corynebacterium lemuris]MCS5479845.1 hypothetical protein [Corynebacterium lemuris]
MKLTPISKPLTLFGEGFPTGVVAAPVGSIYTDVFATNGAIRWIKTAGTGTGGWSVMSGTTGWRRLHSPTVPTEWGEILFQIDAIREENNVTMNFTAYRPGGDNGTRRVLTVPSGFRTDKALFSVPLLDRDNRPAVNYFDISVTGEMTMQHLPTSTGRHYGSISWRCSSAWPIVLPGTPV